MVTPDELTDRDDLEIGCTVNGNKVQKGRTSALIFPVAALVSHLSHNVILRPGDVIFSGTPAGVGVARRPPQYLRPGDTLVSWIEGIGQLHQHFV